MINDLLTSGKITKSADIVVIGAGSVGLYISCILASRGHEVINIESGGFKQDQETHSLNEVVYKNFNYNSSNIGRFRCLGGTSSRWGGGLLPLVKCDLSNWNWPITAEELSKY